MSDIEERLERLEGEVIANRLMIALGSGPMDL